MSDLQDRVNAVVSLIYQGVAVEENFSNLCRMMTPVIRQRCSFFINKMADSYEFDDFYQEACVTIWRITVDQQPEIHTSAFAYLSCAIWYEFIDLFYNYVIKNGSRKYVGEDCQTGLSVYNAFELAYIEKRKTKAKERRLRKYIEEHGHPPIKKPPLSPEEKKIRQREYRKAYYWSNREKLSFISKERRRMEQERIIFGKRLSAKQIITDDGESKYIIVEGTMGRLPYSATMPEDDYLEYLDRKYAKKPKKIKQVSEKEVSKPVHKEPKLPKSKHSSETKPKTKPPAGQEKKRFDRKEYYQTHKEEISRKRAQYYREHAEERKRKSREYYYKNRDSRLAYSNMYNHTHKEELREYRKNHYDQRNARRRERRAEEKREAELNPFGEAAKKREERLAKQRARDQARRERKKAEKDGIDNT